MVRIIEVKQSENKQGKSYVSLKLQGGVEAIQSMQTGKLYLTARTCFIPTTFDEATAESLIGTQLSGTVQRVESEAYEYTIKETGEVITLCHSYEYSPNETPTATPVRAKEIIHAEV